MTPHEAIAIHDPIEEGRLVELEDVHIDHDDELNDIENPDEEGPAEEGGKKQKKKKKRRPTRKQASALAVDLIPFFSRSVGRKLQVFGGLKEVVFPPNNRCGASTRRQNRQLNGKSDLTEAPRLLQCRGS